MKIKVKVTGDKEIIAKIKKFGQDGLELVEQETKEAAFNMQSNAKRNVRTNGSIDTANMIQNIITQRVSDLHYIVSSLATYSAYVEFGTGGHEYVSIPDELKDLAAQYKGTKGRIRRMEARPFMYPALLVARKEFPERLKNGLKKLIKENG